MAICGNKTAEKPQTKFVDNLVLLIIQK